MFYDSILRFFPVMLRIVHHDVDEHRHQSAKDGGAVRHLPPVDAAVPCRSTMDEPVAQHIDFYCPRLPIGGGAWSGKDFKVDRTGHIQNCKLANLAVMTGLCEKAPVRLL